MDDVAAWLKKIGLGQYTERFQTNDITATVLQELSEDDLRELGLSLGHRRLLLKAIKALSPSETLADDGAFAPSPAQVLATTHPGAERRQLTVLMCDLVGSTELTARLDPEDMSRLIRAYQSCCAKTIKHWGGQVANYMGDGVLAFFGWPQAHEDDAERAVRTGLDLAERVGELSGSDGKPLAVRVGIATGLVMIGSGAAQQEAVVGETPNLAARLQGLAMPGSVVIAPGTRQLLGGIFELDDMGAHDIKGIAVPMNVWRVVSESPTESRFDALHGGQISALIGREHELNLVLDRWERAKDSEGQVVLLGGEPGIGKSRIVRALYESLANESPVTLSYYCSPYHRDTALYPVVSLLQRSAGFGPDDEPGAKLNKLEAFLAGTEALTETIPLMAALLGVATGERYPPLALSPQLQKQRTLQLLVEQIEGLATRQPVLAVFEDVHWVDPTTLELLGSLIERAQNLPVLVLITFRPEFRPPWTGHSHVMQLTLSRLTRRHAKKLIEEVTVGKGLPDEVLDQIVSKTGGIPLFVEELTRTVLESGLLTDAGDHFTLAAPLAPLAIPATLRDSLMARLDRTGPAKIIAQVGAVLGHRFGLGLLRLIWNGSDDELQNRLKHLVHASILVVRETSPRTEFEFRHSLMEDVAYESLLREDRRHYHSLAAEALNSNFRAIVDERPELIARHYSGAGNKLSAFESWLEAGKAAARRSANKEALNHMNAAQMELKSVGTIDNSILNNSRLELLMSRGPVLVALRGWSEQEVENNYTEALSIVRSLDQSCTHRFNVWRGLFNVFVLRGDLNQAEEAANRLREIAIELNDQDLLLSWHRAVGLCDFLAARFSDASKHMGDAMASFDASKHPRHTFAQGSHPAVVAYSIGAWAHWFRGNSNRAVQDSSAAIEAAEKAEHPFSLAYALCLASSLSQCRELADDALRLSESALDVSKSYEFPYWRAWASIVKGWCRAAFEDSIDGVAMLKEGISQYNSTGAAQIRSYGLCLLAETNLRMGRWREVIEATESAITEIRRSGIVFYEPEAHRLRGESLCQMGAGSEGLRALLQAVRIAHLQRSNPMLLRASISLLRWLDRDQLRPLIFTRAKRVLAQMEQSCTAAELANARHALESIMACGPNARQN